MSVKERVKPAPKRNRVNYVMEENGKPKWYHANPLKRYFRRGHVNQAIVLDETSPRTTEMLRTPEDGSTLRSSANVAGPDSPFALRSDAANQGLGAVFLQFFQDSPHPVA